LKTLLINNYSPYLENIINVLNILNQNYECYDYLSGLAHYEFPNTLNNFDNVIISGRQRNFTNMNRFNSLIIKDCVIADKPLLGICYGGQILALTFGSTMKKITKIQGIEKISLLEFTDLIPDSNYIEMFESHGFCISHLSKDFRLLGASNSCQNELFQYRKKPIFGTQFHPEKSGIAGKSFIENFLKL
jgi:GMP synthase (glutamine-hydrolysing)